MVDYELIQEIQENKSVNRLHSILLILAMTALLSIVGFLTFGKTGFVISLVFVWLSCVMGQRVSTAWIMRMYKATEIQPHQAPGMYEAFGELAKRAKLEHAPKLYYIPTRMPNAFATGHNKSAAIAVTDGILRMMNPREMNGILAHEMAHLMHRDTKVMGLADTMARIASTASRIGFFMILISGFAALFTDSLSRYHIIAFVILFISPTLMILMQLALSRSREFNADLGAVQLTGDALGLASALQKLDRLSSRNNFWQRILQPGQRRAQPAILRTHPATEERVKRLLEHADKNELAKIRQTKQQAQRQSQRRVAIPLPRVRTRPKYRISSGLWH